MVANQQHPSELNPLQQYRQASSFLRGTSRATNDGWYRNALEQEFQAHLRIDGSHAELRLYRRSTQTWSTADDLSPELLSEPSRAPELAAALMKRAQTAGADALGFVLHLADEFATTEIDPDLDNPGAIEELREQIVSDPKAVLADGSLSIDEHAWRLIPYPANGGDAIATTVTLSRQGAAITDAVRDFGIAKDFPITTLAVSAPLVALAALPELRTGPCERSFLAVLPYARFTVLAFFNEHGDLQLLRTLQHRGQNRPSNLRHAAATTAAALEMDTPDILILPLNGNPDPQMRGDLQVVFEQSDIRLVDWDACGILPAEDPEIPPELPAATRLDREVETPLASAETFVTLRKEQWAIQDFLPVPPEIDEIFPSRMEMKLLRGARFTRLGLLGAAALALLWVGFSILGIIRSPEWAFNRGDDQMIAMRLAALKQESNRIDHWNNLLEDRSRGWAAMEMLARFFPEDGGFLVRGFEHSANPESAPGLAEVGFVKQWKIDGMVREDALPRLTKLSTRDGIHTAFAEIARATGNSAFLPDLPTRSIVINVRTVENNQYRPSPMRDVAMSDETSYPFSFNITITQRFESDDPLALRVAATPLSSNASTAP